MSRSYRKTTKTSWTKCDSEKREKREKNKRTRRLVNSLIQHIEDSTELPHIRENANKYYMRKAGKQFFKKDEFPELMRK